MTLIWVFIHLDVVTEYRAVESNKIREEVLHNPLDT